MEINVTFHLSASLEKLVRDLNGTQESVISISHHISAEEIEHLKKFSQALGSSLEPETKP